MHRLKLLPLFLALLCLPFASRAANPAENDLAGTNSISWDTTADLVSANLHNEPLFPLLEAIAHQTGWHIFVEPRADRTVSVKFRNASSGDALHKLLGNLNLALVPKTDEALHLYVFTTRMENATRAVTLAAKPAAAKQKH